MSDPSSRVVAFLLVALALLGAGCGRHLQNSLGLPNQRPVVRLESAPVGGDALAASAALHWSATDPDGRVDHYLVTDDLRTFAREDGWTATAARDRVLSLRRAAQRGIAVPVAESERLRFFAVKAVDDHGLASTPAYRAYFDENAAPTVAITLPKPSALITPSVPPDVIIRWTGSDPDAPNGKPLKYKFRLWSRSEANGIWNLWLANPDTIRGMYAPTFAGWDSLPGDSTQVHYSGLVPSEEYLFAITAIDAQGAYDPVFSLDKNLLRLFVGFTVGPRLAMFNESFSTFFPGLFPIRLDAPAGVPLTIRWYGLPAVQGPNGAIAGYRWVLDPLELDDTARRNRNDVRHWSEWDLQTTSLTLTDAILAKVPPAELHRLYVETIDVLGWRCMGQVDFGYVTPTYARDLLIVDDTRFRGDQVVSALHPDSLKPPFGNWPTRAELDTFLFAVGGVRWRMTPAGRLSPTGIFQGYRFDTLDTRMGMENPTLPLSMLGNYRHIVWITDQKGSTDFDRVNIRNPDQTTTTLRYMSGPNRVNGLAAWVQGGGKLWALGGGFGNATNSPWRAQPPVPNPWLYQVYTSSGPRPDLVPGRFMYDLAHWRSAFAVWGSADRPVLDRTAAAPAAMPFVLQLRNPATDPVVWPFRNANTFYPVTANLEFLTEPNTIDEDVNPSPRVFRGVQALDTLYTIRRGIQVPPGYPASGYPVMTLYHGRECGPVVFTGFDLWSWPAATCRQLADGVLQGMWQLPKSTPVAAAPAGGRAFRR